MSDPSRERQLDSILHAYLQAVDAGQQPDQQEILRAHPELTEDLRAFFADQAQLDRFAQSMNKVRVGECTIGAEDTAAPEDAAPRIRYFGDYELLEEIARGGMGIVYKARQVSLDRIVAVKMVLAGQLASAADVARFHKEAEAAGKLDHPHIVPIYEIGQHEGQHYFSMKLIEGGRLTPEVGPAQAHAKAAQTAARLVATIARAVYHAHQRGILHRDLKPGNILIDRQGEPHVTDFGLARRVEGDSGLTQSGAVVGTPSYMAPEQARADKQLTTGVDVYSLGAILYELQTGRPPFRGETPLQTLILVLEREPTPPRSLQPRADRDLETICLKCLNKDPERRYESAAALADDLERWQRGEPIAARRAGKVERLVKWCRRRPAAAALIGVSVLALAALVVGGLVFSMRLQEEVQSAWASQYVAHMSRMEFDWENSGLDRVRDTLDIYRPGTGKTPSGRKDVRNWEWYLQDRLCRQELHTLRGHKGMVYCVVFSPDGTQVASASRDGTVKLWDTATGKERRMFQEHDPKRQADLAAGKSVPPPTAVYGVAFSPDGKQLATGHEFGGTLRLWNLADGRELYHVQTNPGIRGVVFSPDGRRVATLTGFVASIFQVADGRVLQHLGRRTHCMAYSPDGRLFVTAGGDPGTQDNEESLIELWDVSSAAGAARPLCRFTRHASAVLSATFSPDGKRLATADADGAIKIWDVTAPLEVKVELHTLKGHVKAVTSLAFSPDGTRLASGGADRTVRLWDTGSGQEIQIYRGHGNDAFHALGYPEGVRYRDGIPFAVATLPSLEGNYQHAIFSVAFSPDGTRLASASADGTVKLWNAGFGQQPRIIKDFANSVAVSHDGGRVALASTRGTVLLCDTRTGGVLHELQGLEKSVRGAKGDRVAQVAFSPDSARVAATGAEGIVKTWDTSTGRELLAFRAHGYLARGVMFSPDGTRLATAGFKDEHHMTAEVKLWDSTGGQEIRTIPLQYNYTAHFLAFSPDWNRLALTEQQGVLLYLWDVHTGQEIRQFRKPSPQADNSIFTTMAFSADGVHVAVGLSNGKVELWDAGAGHVVRTLQGSDTVVAVCFTPDGTRLVSGHRDGAVILWDMATGQEVRTLKGHIRSIKSLSFSKDGTALASAAWDGTVRIWDTRPWTPAIGIELEAAALVDSLFARPLPKSAVQSVLRDRLHLDDAVRRQALEFVDHYAEETDPLKYYLAAWPVLRHPHANEYMAESALEQMTAARRLVVEEEAKPYRGSYKNYVLAGGEVAVQETNQRQDHAFLGMAHYRMGRFKKEHYKEALAVLTKCNPARPTTLAFLAMTHHQLGQKAEAEAALTRLRDHTKKAGSAQDRPFLAEAEAVIQR